MKRLTPISGLGWSELDFGRAHPHAPGLFPSDGEFVARWTGDRRVFAVVHRDHLVDFARLGLPTPRVLAKELSAKHILVSNR